MSRQSIYLFTFFFTAMVLFTSCEKEETIRLSSTDAKESFRDVDFTLSAELENFSNAEGFKALETLASLTNGGSLFTTARMKDARKNPAAYVRKTISNFQHMISEPSAESRAQGNEPFNYTQHKGIYTWKPSIQDFEYTGQSNIIELRFPTNGSTTNNAVFRLTNYAEVETPFGDEAYSPTAIEATLDINNVKQASLSLSATYKADGTDDPVFADISYFVSPYTLDINLDDTKPSITTFSQYLSKNNDKLIGWALTASYKGAKIETNLSKLEGTVQLASAIFTIVITAPEDPTGVPDLNDIIKINVTVDGKLAGKVIWVTEAGATEPSPYLQYNDGSQQKLSDIFKSLEVALSGLTTMV